LFQLPAATVNHPDLPLLPPPPETTGNLNVIVADLSDLRPFAGDTVDWLIQVARLIFEPLRSSSLYTFTTGTLEQWLDEEMDAATWVPVAIGAQLKATIYEFVPDNGVLVALTKISLRDMSSDTTNTTAHQARQFREALLRRDQSCVISQNVSRLHASHLVPRRLGDAGVQSVIDRFTVNPTEVNRFSPIIGLLLFVSLDDIVDTYMVGFLQNGPVSLLQFILYHINI
jgi:hypothetical protein